MKKIIITIGGIAILSLSACTKDWTCSCTDQSNNTDTHVIHNASLSDAKNTCSGYEYHTGPLYNNCSVK